MNNANVTFFLRMISVNGKSISLLYVGASFLFLASLLVLVPVKAEKTSDSGFNFVAAGDWGCGHEAVNTFSMMKSMKPELYLGLGDYSYESSIDCWTNIVNSVGESFKIALGNHDTQGQLLKAYMDKFNLEKQYYSFNYRNAHFIALSTQLDEAGQTEQLKFLKSDLVITKANKNIDWTIVFFHIPFYSADDSYTTNMRITYHPVFDEFGVDLVLEGHSHNYQRSYPLIYNDIIHSEPTVSDKEQFRYENPHGPIFAIVGTGGESVKHLNNKYFLAKTYEGYGCINVEIFSKFMNVEYYSDTDKPIDKFSITKYQHNPNIVDVKSDMQNVDYYKPPK